MTGKKGQAGASARSAPTADRTLPPKTNRQTDTASADPWKTSGQTYTRGKFLRDLGLATRMTSDINGDPDEVRKLQKAIADADAGKAKPHRRRGTKSDT
jgi:hypothetical protein